MATLDFVGIEKSYGAVRVLHRVDLSVADGEFLVLVGPSGCGKSTLLRSIAGLEEITSGELRIDGKRVNDTAPADRDVAMVFQSYALYPHMTVRENMAFALRLKKHPETDARVAEAARMLGLEPLLDRLPKELSGGQRQRVAMGRAIVRRPKVFLFDEPLSNLDAALRQQLRVEIKRLQSSLRTTTVYVTHDQIEAMTLADRIVVLQGGVLQQVGSPDELYNNPANRFVAGFIGSPSMNFLEKVEAGVVVGVRPNDVVLGAGPLRGQVEVVERMGFESMVHLRVGGEALVVRVEGEPPKGEVQLRLERFYRFDPATGARVR
ncbi:MAG TPA: ATP-binding cassette domain-containing protein [Myxococcota bacterium]|nr:ATP-binding cassette domain-containing protein [Myxococcota bacterium]HNH48946.1 ATP-binding cassette domain-containing protein [Myxococcota bacterium]